MKRMLIVGVAIILIFPVVYGCASIMHGVNQDVGVSSQPTGAQITIDNKPYGKTPLIAKLGRGDNHIVRIDLEGYQPFETTLTRKVSGWVWGNVVFGGLIGLAVDAISGGLYNLTPEQIAGVLNKENVGYLYKSDAVYVAVVLSPDPTWKKIATLEPIH